jgi:hypothetical protein
MSINPINYNRKFSHKDWIDFVDSVQAGGTNGINVRMHAIEGEFDALAQAITLINTALQTLGATPQPKVIKQTLIPAFVAVGANGWAQNGPTVSKEPGATTAHGIMPVDLPDGAILQQFVALGGFTPATANVPANPPVLSITLQRFGPTTDTVATVKVTLTTATAFNVTGTITPAFAVIQRTNYSYFISADITQALTLPTDTVQISQLQIAFQVS